jgi:hypothetical protein
MHSHGKSGYNHVPLYVHIVSRRDTHVPSVLLQENQTSILKKGKQGSTISKYKQKERTHEQYEAGKRAKHNRGTQTTGET